MAPVLMRAQNVMTPFMAPGGEASDYIAPNAYVRQERMNVSPTITIMTSDYIAPNAYVRQGRINASLQYVMTSDYIAASAYVRQGRMNASPTLTVGAPLMAPVLMRTRNVMTPLMAPVSDRSAFVAAATDSSPDAPDVYRDLFAIVIKLTRLNLGVDTLRF